MKTSTKNELKEFTSRIFLGDWSSNTKEYGEDFSFLVSVSLISSPCSVYITIGSLGDKPGWTSTKVGNPHCFQSSYHLKQLILKCQPKFLSLKPSPFFLILLFTRYLLLKKQWELPLKHNHGCTDSRKVTSMKM